MHFLTPSTKHTRARARRQPTNLGEADAVVGLFHPDDHVPGAPLPAPVSPPLGPPEPRHQLLLAHLLDGQPLLGPRGNLGEGRVLEHSSVRDDQLGGGEYLTGSRKPRKIRNLIFGRCYGCVGGRRDRCAVVVVCLCV